MDIRDELNVSPRRRITVPEGSRAIIIPERIVEDIASMCKLLRRTTRIPADDQKAVHAIAGDLLLAIVESE
jgi:hypothetical protein